ncbi:MAG: type IV pilus assembly protein PilM [Deltaproteobacteria bacterium]|nr:type IV pilus assembly protein PilM [Deltaproteobacteria bacterium]
MARKLCLGIDIGASAVKLCLLARSKRTYMLERFGIVPLPSETIVDGALMNSARVVEAITELISAHRIKVKQAAIAISGHSVIIKKIPLPQMTREELEDQIQWEAEQFIPFDINDVNLDVQIVNQESSQKGHMDVVLVAAKKDYVNEYTSVVIEAGLEPVICDIDAFAVQNMFEANYEMQPEKTYALVNIGAAKTNINIVARGISTFTRDLTVGGNTFTEEIQKQLSVSREEAEALKIGSGAEKTNNVDMVVPQEVDRAIRSIAESVTTEIQRSIDFYVATSADPAPAAIYISGGSARLSILIKAIEERMGIPIIVADPFRQIVIADGDREYTRLMGPTAAVAVGLALRFPGDS